MTASAPPIRVGVIGMNHMHIFEMVMQLAQAGAAMAAYLPREGDLSGPLSGFLGDARTVTEPAEIYEDDTIDAIVSAGISNERAPVGIEAMRHGKDFLSDKPAFTTLAQLEEARQVQQDTGRIFSVFYGERFESRATVKAGELVAAGAIGRVIHTAGFGPHRLNAPERPKWFFQRERYGGILTDIASHQMDQFLYFTGATEARVVSSRVANHAHPEYPELEDFGEAMLEADGATGYVRVDWFTPDGLPVWGDGRLTILGTEGYIEIRKEIDLAGRPNGNHLFCVDGKEVRYVDCENVELPFAREFLYDVAHRTETAMSQHHCFLASELALRAQAQAAVVAPGKEA